MSGKSTPVFKIRKGRIETKVINGVKTKRFVEDKPKNTPKQKNSDTTTTKQTK